LFLQNGFLLSTPKLPLAGQVLQPYSGSLFRTHQKLQVGVSLLPTLNVFNQQDIKVVLLQNYAWPMASYLLRPTIYRGNYFEYSDEAANSFPAGKEWRWIDLRSIRLMSERMQRLDKQPTRTDVYILPDNERKQQIYHYYRDLNGFYSIETTDNVNPFWQSDYVYTHFTFFPPAMFNIPDVIFIYLVSLQIMKPMKIPKWNLTWRKGRMKKRFYLNRDFMIIHTSQCRKKRG
jgi:hypothetical protein